jgi:iron complex transport system permease protein
VNTLPHRGGAARRRTVLAPAGGRLSVRLDHRSAAVCGLLALVTAAIGVVALGTGSLPLGPGRVLAALFDPDAAPADRLVVVDWRLPRLLFGVVCGAALGVSGAIFQSLTRNPLGSPDVIGFSSGSYAGASAVLLALGSTGYYTVAGGALIGGAASALLVYVLAYRHGLHPFRLIIVGIAVGAFLSSVTSAMLLSVSPEKAMLAATWGAGSLSDLGFDQLGPVTAVFVPLMVCAVLVARPLGQLELGDDTAAALGVDARRTRLAATVTGVALTALVTACAGPIAFVALAAPQIAQRLTRTAGRVGVLSAALTGAAVLVASDHLAQRLQLPVGVVTVSVGGLYLAWLLGRQYAGRRT